MIVIEKNQAFSDSGKCIHRLGSDSYFKKCTVLSGESEANFEEVDEIPSEPSEDEIAYKEEVDTMVREMFFSKNISKSINTFALSNQQALAVKDYFPEWNEDLGELLKGNRYKCEGLLWEVIKTHTAQANWKPSLSTASLWKVVEIEHEGTIDDPIPYTQMMAFEKGKYYTQYGVLYLCILTTLTGYPNDLKDLPTIVTKVEG